MQLKYFPEPDGLRTLIVPRNQQNTNDDPWLAKPPPASATSWPIGAAAHNKAPTNSYCTKYASLLDLQCLEPLTLKWKAHVLLWDAQSTRFRTVTSNWNPESQAISWQNWRKKTARNQGKHWLMLKYYWYSLLKTLPKAQRPEGWVLLTKVTSLGHITSSYTNLDQTSSESCRGL